MHCRTIFFLFGILLSISSFSQKNNQTHEGKMTSFMYAFDGEDTMHIGVLAYEGMILEDFAGPIEVFSKAKGLTNNHYLIYVIGLNTKPVHTENKIVTIHPDFTLDNMPSCDYFILPGGSMSIVDSLRQNQAFQQAWASWKKKTSSSKLVSICTAAYFLGQEGMLNGKNATTHFFVADDFATMFPQVHIKKNVRFVEDGNILTSSGVTSGIDLALYIVKEINGEKIQAMIARALQYDYHQEEAWPVAPMGMHFKR